MGRNGTIRRCFSHVSVGRAYVFVGLLTVVSIAFSSGTYSDQVVATAMRVNHAQQRIVASDRLRGASTERDSDRVGLGAIDHAPERDRFLRSTAQARVDLIALTRRGRLVGAMSWVGTAVAIALLAALYASLGRESAARERLASTLIVEREAQASILAELRAANAALEHRVQELGRSNAVTEASNAELEAFSYAVSHDLRTPLRAIEGFAHALDQDFAPVLGDGGRDFLARIHRAAARMGEIIDDMLALSHMTRASLVRDPIDVTAIAEDVARALRASDVTRDVEFVIERGVKVFGDPGLVRIVFENLLENAWKFTARVAPAHITVGTVAASEGRLVYVRDDGAGFDPAMARKLFGAFQRLHRDDQFSGSGIGLATVKRVMMLHGGHVRAEGATDRGATFFLRFPEPESFGTMANEGSR